MHEIGVAKEIFKAIKELAEKNNLKKITKIRIRVGEQSGVVEELLKHSLCDHLFPGTIAAEAELEIVKELLHFRCQNCGKEFNLSGSEIAKCDSCGSENVETISGTDVYLDHLEGEEEEG